MSSGELVGEEGGPTASVKDNGQSFLSRRVKTITSMDNLFDDLSSSQLEYLSKLIESDPVGAKRNLKGMIEKALVDVHARFVGEYERYIQSAVVARYTNLTQIEDCVSGSVEKLTVGRERIGEAIDLGISASTELAEVERKLDLLKQFQDNFVIEANDNVPVAASLSDILKIVEVIERKRQNCQVLLKAIPNAHQAIESLNRSVQVLDGLYEKAFYGVIKVDGDVEAETFRKSLLFLQDRPHLFHEALSSICQRRCDDLSGGFLRVLTQDGDGLELNSFDTVRFASDMLSWFLDSVLSEKDWLDSVVGDARESLWSISPVVPRVDYLDMILVGVEEMIDSRFSNSVKSTFNVLDLFKLAKIVSFYLGKIKHSTGMATQSFLKSLHHSAFAAFQFQWEQRVITERNSVLVQFSPGLSPPSIVNETVFLIDNILLIEAESESVDLDEDRSSLFSVLSSGIDPLIQVCVQSKAGGSPTESAVFLINCLAVLQGPLKKYSFTAETVGNLEVLIAERMDSLIRETTAIVLVNTGLGTKLEALRSAIKDKKPVDTVSELHPITLSSSVKSFYSLLFTQGISAISHTDSLISKELRAKARHDIGVAIADVYEELYVAVHELGVTTHTPDQVRALLDI
jgi:hypothetical protein